MLARGLRDRCAEVISWVRIRYYRFMGVAVGKNCYISSDAHIDVRRGRISIGNQVHVSSGSYILGHAGQQPLKEGLETRLDDNVIVYVNAVVMPGVKVGKNSVVGAGSVVTRDVPPDVIVMGNPARVIGRVWANSEPQPTPPSTDADLDSSFPGED